MTAREDRIRAKAHELWEAEGRPGDRAEDHWAEAERMIDAERSEADSRPSAETEARGIDIGPSPDGDLQPIGPARAGRV